MVTTDGHRLSKCEHKLREGTPMVNFSMLVPTTWNFPTCSRALTGAPWQVAEMIVRGYDPCVSCATHMIVIDEDRKVIAQKLIQ